MGQRGIWNISLSGVNYYWKNFYFIHEKNYNWFYQEKFLNIFCNYFFIWVTYLNKFFIKFINFSIKKIFSLHYYYYFYKLRLEKLNFLSIWFFKNIIFRYNKWVVIYIEYYRHKKQNINSLKSFKKIRSLINLNEGEGYKEK